MKRISSLLICAMIAALVSYSKPSEISHLDDKKKNDLISERNAYLFNFWELYKSSNGSEKPKAIKELRDAVTKVAHLDSMINMLGLVLFGPEHKGVIRCTRDERSPFVDDERCLKSTLKLFKRICGGIIEQNTKQAFANICNYVADKRAIKEAIILTCGMHITHNTESHVIDMRNPKLNVTPTPIHATFEYCGRAYVKGNLRTRLWSYAKAFHVTVVPSKSILNEWHNQIQICFHRNESQGLCQCEKDDWRSLQKGSWSSIMSPFEQRIVDVKFLVRLEYSFVTVSINEVSQVWRLGLLIGGVALLLIAVSKGDPLSTSMVDNVGKWAMCVLGVACIFMSSIDTVLAVVAVCSSVLLCHMFTSFIAASVRKVTKLWPQIGRKQVNTFGNGGRSGIKYDNNSTFHTLRNRKKSTAKDLTGQFIADLANSSEFEEWMINNAHRIRFR